jgi:tetratricopeptide (TPR) repeat protein
VVGVPPSDPPPSETPPSEVAETKAPATTRSSVGAKLLEAAVEAEAEAKAEEKIEAKVEPPPPEPPKPDLAKTVVHGSAETAPAPNFAKTLAFGSKATELPQSERVETAKERAASQDLLKEKREKAQAAQKAISPKEDPDEISVPPVNDMNVEDEKFFDEAEVAVRKSVHEFEMLARQEEEEAVPERTRRKLDPQVIRRRERFAGYVKLAVAGAAIVCLAAMGRSALHSRASAPAQAPAAIAAAPETPVEPKAAEPAAAPVATEEAKPAEPAPPASASAAPAEEPKAEAVTGDPKEELKKSRTALEKRKLPEAIEAGERAVALDPTDGEAWLILGASYQEKGDLTNAHRCYVACVKEGKTGPVAECRKMLR